MQKLFSFNLEIVLIAGGVVSLGAAKTSFGHAETAAGTIGLNWAYENLLSTTQIEFIHLRQLNSYVSNIYDNLAKLQTAGSGKSTTGHNNFTLLP